MVFQRARVCVCVCVCVTSIREEDFVLGSGNEDGKQNLTFHLLLKNTEDDCRAVCNLPEAFSTFRRRV